MSEAKSPFERWPGYDEQSWQQRFIELDRQFQASSKSWQEAILARIASTRTPMDGEVGGALPCYDAGLLGDFGGGDVAWWQDYIRLELENAHDFYAEQHTDTLTAYRDKVERLRALLIDTDGVRDLLLTLQDYAEDMRAGGLVTPKGQEFRELGEGDHQRVTACLAAIDALLTQPKDTPDA